MALAALLREQRHALAEKIAHSCLTSATAFEKSSAHPVGPMASEKFLFASYVCSDRIRLSSEKHSAGGKALQMDHRSIEK